MTILSLRTGRNRFPTVGWVCEDPRHRDGDDAKAVAVVETEHDAFAVCENCRYRIEAAGA